MKKLTDFLEKNVQWLVLGLAGLYVVYMAWTYIIVSPVKVTGIAPEPLPPGDVDNFIYTTVAQPLDDKIKDTHVPSMPMPSFVPTFLASMNYDGKSPEPWKEMLAVLPSATPVKTDLTPGIGAGPNNLGVVEKLPVLTAPTLVATRAGMSSIIPNDNATTPPVDKSWVSVRFEVNSAALVQAWNDAKIPAPSANTAFLQVILERQELQPDETWGQQTTVIAPLAIQKTKDFPADNAPTPMMWDYIQWAEQNTVDIVQPAFYTVAKGDPWSVPGEAAPNAAMPPEQFNPANYVNATPAELSKLTPEQKQQIYAYKEKQKQTAQKGKRSNSPGPSGGGNGSPGDLSNVVRGPRYAPNDPDRPSQKLFFQAGEPDFVRQMRAAQQQASGAPVTAGPNAAPGAPSKSSTTGGDFPLPVGEFDPHKWADDHPKQATIVGWAHDDTVVPGQTYRYRITYKLKNPIFFAVNIAKIPKLTEVLALVSPPSAWSDKVEVVSNVRFWIARSPSPRNTVPIQIFRWQGGEPKTKMFDIAPGDSVGDKVGDIDYSTGWTMVDVGKDPRTDDYYVLLMDPSGSLHKRDVRSDSQDPKYLEMKQQAASASASASTDTIAGTR
jgi:hypothetical protein